MSCALFALLAMAGNLSLTDPVVGTPTETDHLGFTVGGAQFELYGFVRLDAIWDDSRPQDPEVPGWILSEDGAAPPGISDRCPDPGVMWWKVIGQMPRSAQK